MGLFSVLTDSTNGGEKTSSSSSSSGSIPTVVQLYSSGDEPIQLEETSVLSGYSALTYQAIQIGSQEEEEVKNRHQTPDLGVWNCHVRRSKTSNNSSSKEASSSQQQQQQQPQPLLVDSLLATVAKQVRVFCLTVDLSQPNQVEPSLTLLQTALVRHLIEHPPTGTDDDSSSSPETTTPERQTATTSLYQLQTTEFGKANEEESKDGEDGTTKKTTNIDNDSAAFRSIRTTLMICAKLPPSDATSSGAGAMDDADAYKTKQAQTLVIYHLRKFAAALNCSLCFVESSSPPANTPDPATTPTAAAGAADSTPAASSTVSLQPTANYHTLSQWWRGLALDEAIWDESSTTSKGDLVKSYSGGQDGENTEGEGTTTTITISEVDTDEPVGVTPETVVVAAPLYGPGKHQEDLIESVLLRSANYPGHWDAGKDSLWVALPATKDHGGEEDGDDATAAAATARTTGKGTAGDGGWLGQLRESIASAQDLPPPGANSSPEKQSHDDKKDGKDAEVSDFFASLLKKP